MKDPTEFRQRFAAWKNGDKVYEAGRILPEVVVTADDPIKKLVEDVNTRSNADFVNRAKDPNRTWIQDWEHDGYVATHKLSWAEDNGKAIVFPNVQNINGKLHDFTDPKYNHGKWDALDSAIERGDTLLMTPLLAKMYTENYKKYYPKGKTFDCGKSLPKYDGGTSDKTYLPEYEKDITPKTYYDRFGLPNTMFSSVDEMIAWYNPEEWLNKDLAFAIELPEVVVKPSYQDKQVLRNTRLMIPDKMLRDHVYKDIENKIGYDLTISENEALDRLNTVYNWSGRPLILSEKDSPYESKFPNSDVFRAYYQSAAFPFIHNKRIFKGLRIYLPYYSKDLAKLHDNLPHSAIIPELAHAYQYNSRNGRLLMGRTTTDMNGVGGDIKDINGHNAYLRLGNIEFNAHEIILPAIESFITGKIDNLPKEIKRLYDAYDSLARKQVVPDERNKKAQIPNRSLYEDIYEDVYQYTRLLGHDKGKSIHINPANKGKFNATKKRTGKTTEQLAHSKNPLTRKRAVFALNSRKWSK